MYEQLSMMNGMCAYCKLGRSPANISNRNGIMLTANRHHSERSQRCRRIAMENDIQLDSYDLLIQLCEDFMESAVAANNSLGNRDWTHIADEYKDYAKTIKELRAKLQQQEDEKLASIRLLEMTVDAAKESIGASKKAIDEGESNLSALRQRSVALDHEEKDLMTNLERIVIENDKQDSLCQQRILLEAAAVRATSARLDSYIDEGAAKCRQQFV